VYTNAVIEETVLSRKLMDNFWPFAAILDLKK
jgi:hypothetical protein